MPRTRARYRITRLISIKYYEFIYFSHTFFKLLPRIASEREHYRLLCLCLPSSDAFFCAQSFFSGACWVRFLSVFITALILHSTDYFMLHFAPCRCSPSFVMISVLGSSQTGQKQPNNAYFSYLAAASDDDDDDDEKKNILQVRSKWNWIRGG